MIPTFLYKIFLSEYYEDNNINSFLHKNKRI